MKTLITLFIASCFCMTTAQTAMDQKNETKDAKFAKEAAKIGMMEVKLSQLAQTNAMAPEVKTNAAKMIADHGKANEELKSIASRKNILLPLSIDENQQEKHDELAILKGSEFDKKYTKYMIKDHRKAISLFKKESEHGDDAELKAWAAEKLPTLEHHLKIWEETEGAVKMVQK